MKCLFEQFANEDMIDKNFMYMRPSERQVKQQTPFWYHQLDST